MSSPYFIRSMLSYIKNLRLYLKIRCELRNIIHSRILERYPYYLPSKNYFPRTQSNSLKKKEKEKKNLPNNSCCQETTFHRRKDSIVKKVWSGVRKRRR